MTAARCCLPLLHRMAVRCERERWGVYGLVARDRVSAQQRTTAPAHSTSSSHSPVMAHPRPYLSTSSTHRRSRGQTDTLPANVRNNSRRASTSISPRLYCPTRPARGNTWKHATTSSVFSNCQNMPGHSLAPYSGPASSSTTGQWSDAPYISLRISHIFTRSSKRSLTTTARPQTKKHVSDARTPCAMPAPSHGQQWPAGIR